MAKKLKKILKRALPLAALGLGAAALAKRKRHLGVRDTDDAGLGAGPWVSRKVPNKGNTAPMFDYGDAFSEPNWAAAKGGRAMKSKGGRVTGAAKRGFGRALMKGKK